MIKKDRNDNNRTTQIYSRGRVERNIHAHNSIIIIIIIILIIITNDNLGDDDGRYRSTTSY